MKNPLLQKFDTYLETAPFSRLKPEHFAPAIKKYIAEAEQEIDHITNNPQTPDFDNTIAALDFAGMQLDRITSILSNLNSAETNEEIQKTADEMMPLLTEFYNNIKLNQKLFERIKYVHEHPGKLTGEQQMLLDKTYKSFVRNGAGLPEEQQKPLREIDRKLTLLKLAFSKNVLQETNAFQLHVTDEKDLEGLPETYQQAAQSLAGQKDMSGWLFTLQAPSYLPFMKYVKNRELRKQMSLAYGSRAFHNNEFDNRNNIMEIARLRKERARLLGYDTHADFVLEERMAQNPENVLKFLDDLHKPAYPAAQKDVERLTELAQKDGIEKPESWDIHYYMERLKEQELDLNEEELKAYFEQEKVLQGLFTIAGKLYGLNFQPNKNIDRYHADVQVYEVTDENGELIAVFYVDLYTRPGKRAGAWETSYKGQWKKDGVNSRPHVSIVTNFARPQEGKPNLLNFREVTTLFHEFGHALHAMLADTVYPGLSGTHVYWDFVELPSQLMENWAYEKEALDLFATHYQTGEKISAEMIEKIKKSLQFMEAYATNRQLSFGYLDMAWHYHFDSDKAKDVSKFEECAFAKTQLLPYNKNTNMSVAFSHIFAGGYASGYYSYKWAEVLDADAFAYFKEKGIFNKEVAGKFKKLLQSGGTKHPMDLYKSFRGKEPDVKALLKRAGLLQ